MTMQVIQHIKLTGTQANIEFTSIPNTFTDLYLLISARSTRADDFDAMFLYPNGVTANQSFRSLFGTGSSSGSFTDTKISAGAASGANATSNTFSSVAVYIPNYRSAAAKSFSTDTVTENNATSTRQNITASLWNDTAAITSLTIDMDVANFAAGSSATLYGITKGSDGTTTVS